MYLSAIILANLVRTKAVFQLLRLQVHTPSITPKSETVKGHVISF